MESLGLPGGASVHPSGRRPGVLVLQWGSGHTQIKYGSSETYEIELRHYYKPERSFFVCHYLALMEEWLPPSRSGSYGGARHPLAKACDQCHRCKIACDGRRPACDRCAKNSSTCTYSTGKPIGKPKGSKNRGNSEAQRPIGNKDSAQSKGDEYSGKRKDYTEASRGVDELVVRTAILPYDCKMILTTHRTTNGSGRTYVCHLLRASIIGRRESSKNQIFSPELHSHRFRHQSHLTFSSCNPRPNIMQDTTWTLPSIPTPI